MDYAQFNDCPHTYLDLPDGVSTLSARTSDGRRITFSFMPYTTGGPPDCVDVVYHDGTTDGQDVIGLAQGGGFAIDTRTLAEDRKPKIICVMMEKQNG